MAKKNISRSRSSRSFVKSIGAVRGRVKEYESRKRLDLLQREKAGKSPASIILNPNDVQGDYDATRTLLTTLGGVRRAITSDDLAAFRTNIRTVQKKYKSGITAQQVIDFSLRPDLDRAVSEIKISTPVSARNGIVSFMTNAGPESDVTRHHVTVNFLSFVAAVSAGRSTAKKMAAWLRHEPLAFDCDCGRHRYWYRYISTIGGFNAGRPETGFPKIRNPKLTGLACKHVIRTMSNIASSVSVLIYLERLIEKARKSDIGDVKDTLKQKDLNKILDKEVSTNRKIKTTDVRNLERELRREKAALKKASLVAPLPQKVAAKTRKLSKDAQGLVNALRELGLSEQKIEEAVKMAFTKK